MVAREPISQVAVDVELIPWPAEADRRARIGQADRPRLLLVAPEQPAPICDDPLEDWIRLPAPDADVRVRVARLARQAGSDPRVGPVLDEQDVLRFGPRIVALPPIEARLMRTLLGRPGAVVSRQRLGRAGWPDGVPSRNVLDVLLGRLRRRVEPVGVRITTVRARGCMVEWSLDDGARGRRRSD